MIPKIIHQTVEEGPLLWEERRIVRKATAILPGWDYRLWEDRDRLLLIETAFPSHSKKYKEITRGIVRSDICRYAFLYLMGGIYIDTDYRMIAAVDDLLNFECILPIEEHNVPNVGTKLGNAILASVPGHAIWIDLADRIFAFSTTDLNEGNPVAMTGPLALTGLWNEKYKGSKGIATPEPHVFYPTLRLLNFGYEREPDTRGVHLCWGGWRGKRGVERARNLVRRKVTGFLA